MFNVSGFGRLVLRMMWVNVVSVVFVLLDFLTWFYSNLNIFLYVFYLGTLVLIWEADFGLWFCCEWCMFIRLGP